MNILIDRPPTTLNVGGEDVPIYTDFRNGLRAMMACEDNSLTPQEKAVCVLANVYVEVPADVQDAIDKALWYLDTGRENGKGSKKSHRTFSWSKDANLIFAAFRQTHGIDLSTVQMHWWEFFALFMDLGSETAFCNLTSLRSRVNAGKASKEEKQLAREMGDAFKVEEIDTRPLEEKDLEREFMKSVKR